MAALLRPRVSVATFWRVNRLTKQEQLVLCTVLGLLLLGLATKTFRASRPMPELPQAAQK
jgi:hypothetical protein